MVSGSKNAASVKSGSTAADSAAFKTGKVDAEKKAAEKRAAEKKAPDGNSPPAPGRSTAPKPGGRCPECNRVNSGKWYRHKTQEGEYTCDGCYRFYKTNSHYKGKALSSGAAAGGTSTGGTEARTSAEPASTAGAPVQESKKLEPASKRTTAGSKPGDGASADGESAASGRGVKRKQLPDPDEGLKQKHEKHEQDQNYKKKKDGVKDAQPKGQGGKPPPVGQASKQDKSGKDGHGGNPPAQKKTGKRAAPDEVPRKPSPPRSLRSSPQPPMERAAASTAAAGSAAAAGGSKGSKCAEPADPIAPGFSKPDAANTAAAGLNPSRRRAAALAAARGIAECAARGGRWTKGSSQDAAGGGSGGGGGGGKSGGGDGDGGAGAGSSGTAPPPCTAAASAAVAAAGSSGDKQQTGDGKSAQAAGGGKSQAAGGASKSQPKFTLAGAAAAAVARRAAILQAAGEVKCNQCGSRESRRWCRHRYELQNDTVLVCERCDDYWRRHRRYPQGPSGSKPQAAAKGGDEAKVGNAGAPVGALASAQAGKKKKKKDDKHEGSEQAAAGSPDAVGEGSAADDKDEKPGKPGEGEPKEKSEGPEEEAVDESTKAETSPALQTGGAEEDTAPGAAGKAAEEEEEVAAEDKPEAMEEDTAADQAEVATGDKAAGAEATTDREAAGELATGEVPEAEVGTKDEEEEVEEKGQREPGEDTGVAVAPAEEGAGKGSAEAEDVSAEETGRAGEKGKGEGTEAPAVGDSAASGQDNLDAALDTPDDAAGPVNVSAELPDQAAAEAQAEEPGPGEASKAARQELPAGEGVAAAAAAAPREPQPDVQKGARTAKSEHAKAAGEAAAAEPEELEHDMQDAQEEISTQEQEQQQAAAIGTQTDSGRQPAACARSDAEVLTAEPPAAAAEADIVTGAGALEAGAVEGATAVPADGAVQRDAAQAGGADVSAINAAATGSGDAAVADSGGTEPAIEQTHDVATDALDVDAAAGACAAEAADPDVASMAESAQPPPGSPAASTDGALVADAGGDARPDGPLADPAEDAAAEAEPAKAVLDQAAAAQAGEPLTTKRSGPRRHAQSAQQQPEPQPGPEQQQQEDEGGVAEAAQRKQPGRRASKVAAVASGKAGGGAKPAEAAGTGARAAGGPVEGSGVLEPRSCSACGSTHTQSGWRRHQGGEVGKFVCKRCYDWYHRHKTYERIPAAQRAAAAAAAAAAPGPAAAAGAPAAISASAAAAPATRRPKRSSSTATVAPPTAATVQAEDAATAATAAAPDAPDTATVSKEAVADGLGSEPLRKRQKVESVEVASAQGASTGKGGDEGPRTAPTPAEERPVGTAVAGVSQSGGDAPVKEVVGASQEAGVDSAVLQSYVKAFGESLESACKALVVLEDQHRIRLLDAPALPPGPAPGVAVLAASGVDGADVTAPVFAVKEATAAQPAQSALRLFYERVCGSDARLRSRYLADVIIRWLELHAWRSPLTALLRSAAGALCLEPRELGEGSAGGNKGDRAQLIGNRTAGLTSDAGLPDAVTAPDQAEPRVTSPASDRFRQVVESLALNLAQNLLGLMPAAPPPAASQPGHGGSALTAATAAAYVSPSTGVLPDQTPCPATAAGQGDSGAAAASSGAAEHGQVQGYAAALPHLQSMAAAALQLALRVGSAPGRFALRLPAPGDPFIPQPHVGHSAPAEAAAAGQAEGAALPDRPLSQFAPAECVPTGTPELTPAAAQLAPVEPGEACSVVMPVEWLHCSAAAREDEKVQCVVAAAGGVEGEPRDVDGSGPDNGGRHVRLAHLLRNLYVGGVTHWQDSKVALSWEGPTAAATVKAEGAAPALGGGEDGAAVGDSGGQAAEANGAGGRNAGRAGAPAVLWLVAPGIVRQDLRVVAELGAAATDPGAAVGVQSSLPAVPSPPGADQDSLDSTIAVDGRLEEDATAAASGDVVGVLADSDAAAATAMSDPEKAVSAADAICDAVATALARGDQDALLGATEAAASVVLQLVRAMSADGFMKKLEAEPSMEVDVCTTAVPATSELQGAFDGVMQAGTTLDAVHAQQPSAAVIVEVPVVPAMVVVCEADP